MTTEPTPRMNENADRPLSADELARDAVSAPQNGDGDVLVKAGASDERRVDGADLPASETEMLAEAEPERVVEGMIDEGLTRLPPG